MTDDTTNASDRREQSEARQMPRQARQGQATAVARSDPRAAPEPRPILHLKAPAADADALPMPSLPPAGNDN